MPIPEDAIAPEIPPGAEVAYMAFSDVSSDRQIGMAMGPIPWSSVDRWCRRHGIEDSDQFDLIWTLVRVMDSAYRKAITPPS